jgi:hypothetical protein
LSAAIVIVNDGLVIDDGFVIPAAAAQEFGA